MFLWEQVFPIIMKNRGFRNGNVESAGCLPQVRRRMQRDLINAFPTTGEIMNDYGHIHDTTLSFAISLYKKQGLKMLMKMMNSI